MKRPLAYITAAWCGSDHENQKLAVHDCRIGESVQADRPGACLCSLGGWQKITKAHQTRQIPHGKQTVKKLMAHGAATNSIDLSGDTKLFDRVARKWNF